MTATTTATTEETILAAAPEMRLYQTPQSIVEYLRWAEQYAAYLATQTSAAREADLIVRKIKAISGTTFYPQEKWSQAWYALNSLKFLAKFYAA